jgi:NAD(P)H dehydrogenase (quinone)
MKIYVIFYSMFGHVYRLAEAIAEGARQVDGAEVSLYRVAETLPDDILEKLGAINAREIFAHVPVIEPAMMADADGLIFGTPTRYGNMCAQMRAFFDATGSLWVKGALVGKVASVFTSTSTQHGGQESTILSTHITLLHHGLLITGIPFTEPRLSTIDEMSGGTPYGASTITGHGGKRLPSENELEIARIQGKHVAEITATLVRGRMPASK